MYFIPLLTNSSQYCNLDFSHTSEDIEVWFLENKKKKTLLKYLLKFSQLLYS